VITLAGTLPFARHLHIVSQAREFFRFATHHQAYDEVGSLQIQAVLVIKDGLDTGILVAPVAEEPARCGIRDHAIRESISHSEGEERRVGIGRILFSPQDRQPHDTDERVADLVGQHEQRGSGHELDVLAQLFRGYALETRGTLEHACGIDDPLLELRLRSGFGRDRGRRKQHQHRQDNGSGRKIDQSHEQRSAHFLRLALRLALKPCEQGRLRP
jgi:hypothetical protein